MNAKLAAAVAIFKELGWDKAKPEDAPSLPIGTPEQRQLALAGLRSGPWGKIGQVDENTFGWISAVDSNESMLALFAIRVGVDARRAVNIVQFRNDVTSEIVAALMVQRGTAFATAVIEHGCRADHRWSEHSTSVWGRVAVSLVDQLGLPIPPNVEYLKDWAVLAAAGLGLGAETLRWQSVPAEDVIKERFTEHVRAGVATGVPATGPFGRVLPEGVRRGWLERAEAIELIFAALDSARRPGDRKVWLEVLDQLGMTTAELADHADLLIPLLATGDSFVVQRVAPALIAQEKDNILVETLAASLTCPVKKTLRLVLQAALARPRPPEAEVLADQVAALATDRDQPVARLATRLAAVWELEAIPTPAPAETEVQRLWRPTPPLWQVPRFDHGPETPEALTDLAAALTRRGEAFADIVEEQFLTVLNAVVRRDSAAARTALRGVQDRGGVLGHVPRWVKGEPNPLHLDVADAGDSARHHWNYTDNGSIEFSPWTARNAAVFQRLGQLPCLLSEPSRGDLVITAADLAARLATYQQEGVTVLEADLFLALIRLDPATATPAVLAQLADLKLPVVRLWQDREPELMGFNAGEAVARYLADPLIEPQLTMNQQRRDWWTSAAAVIPTSLSAFPDRLRHAKRGYYDFTEFPLWGDAAYRGTSWSGEVQRNQGLKLRQVARRSTPLPSGMAINLLAAQRSMHPEAAEDSHLAVIEAWERGLLIPGVASVTHLDWRTSPPSNLASLATALIDIAQEGILSIAWPILDDLVTASLKSPRLLAGTAEVVEVMAGLLPEVVAAVTAGLADPAALVLPGVRALAARSGSSKAVSVAREIVAQLPELAQVVATTNTSAPAPRPGMVPTTDGSQFAVAADQPGLAQRPGADSAAPGSTTGITIHALDGVPTLDAGRPLTSPLPPVLDPPFDEVWPESAGPAVTIPDGVTMTISQVNRTSTDQLFAFQLALPDKPGLRYWIVKSWTYDLEAEGQSQAWELPAGSTAFGFRQPSVWLHWDATTAALVVAQHRNWVSDTNSPLKGTPAPPLPDSLLTVAVGLLAQGTARCSGYLVQTLAERDRLGWRAVRTAARTLLANPVVSPAKLVRTLESNVLLLPLLWPLLTESIRSAAQQPKPPVWANRVLDVALRHAPYLAEAAHRGYLPAEDARWEGLADLAGSKAKSAAVAKAKDLATALSL